MLYGPNTNVGSNSVIFMLEAQARYIVRALKHMRRRRKSYIAVRPEAMAKFIAKIDEWMQGTVWLTRCSNYFRAANGRVVTQWPRSARAFWGMTRRFNASRLHLRSAVAADRTARGRSKRGEPLTSVAHRLDPALRHLEEARTNLAADVLHTLRESLNQRRADAADTLDTAGVDHRGDAGGRCSCARLPWRAVAGPGRRLLPFWGFRSRQPRHRPPAVRGARQARSVHRHLG